MLYACTCLCVCVRIIIQTKICLISLIDTHRCWFKSAIGCTCPEITRNQSLGSHVILEMAPPVIVTEDVNKDPRFHNLRLYSSTYGIGRFYAVASLVVQGMKVGCLCLTDPMPRYDFDEKKMNMLQDIAAMISQVIENKRNEVLNQRNVILQHVLEVNKRLATSLTKARDDCVTLWKNSHNLYETAKEFVSDGSSEEECRLDLGMERIQLDLGLTNLIHQRKLFYVKLISLIKEVDIVIKLTGMFQQVKYMLSSNQTCRKGMIPSCLLMDLFQPENALCNQWSGVVDWEMSEKLEACEIQVDWKSLEVVTACALMHLLEDCTKIQFLASIEKPRGGITGCNITTTGGGSGTSGGNERSHSVMASTALPWMMSPSATSTNNLLDIPPSATSEKGSSSSSNMKVGTLSLVMLLTRPCSACNTHSPTSPTGSKVNHLNQKLSEDTIFYSKTNIITSILESVNGKGHLDMTEPGLQDHYLIKFSFEVPCQYRPTNDGILHSMKQSNKSSMNISWKQDDGQLNFAWTSAAIARFAVVSSTRASKAPCTFNMKSSLIGLEDSNDERKGSDATAMSSDSSVALSNSSKGKEGKGLFLPHQTSIGGKSVSSLSQIVPAESVRMVAEKMSSASPVGFIRKVFSSIFRSNQVLPNPNVRPSQSVTTFTS